MRNVPGRTTAARFSPSVHLAAQFERHQRAHGTAAAIEKLLSNQRLALPAKPRAGEMSDGVRRVVEMVAARHRVPMKLVVGMSRHAGAIDARHEAWFRISACGFSGPQIAKMFRCDPSSIVTARQRFRDRRPELAAEIEAAVARPARAGAEAVN